MKGRIKSQESWREAHQVQRSCGRNRLDVFKEQHGDQPKREGQRTREEGKKKGGKNRGKEG